MPHRNEDRYTGLNICPGSDHSDSTESEKDLSFLESPKAADESKDDDDSSSKGGKTRAEFNLDIETVAAEFAASCATNDNDHTEMRRLLVIYELPAAVKLEANLPPSISHAVVIVIHTPSGTDLGVMTVIWDTEKCSAKVDIPVSMKLRNARKLIGSYAAERNPGLDTLLQADLDKEGAAAAKGNVGRENQVSEVLELSWSPRYKPFAWIHPTEHGFITPEAGGLTICPFVQRNVPTMASGQFPAVIAIGMLTCQDVSASKFVLQTRQFVDVLPDSSPQSHEGHNSPTHMMRGSRLGGKMKGTRATDVDDGDDSDDASPIPRMFGFLSPTPQKKQAPKAKKK